jgi:hypothetical protein
MKLGFDLNNRNLVVKHFNFDIQRIKIRCYNMNRP